MTATAYLTTSWDDGHPLDRRVAELLAKYALRGTFYVPRAAERPTLTAAALRDLGSVAEVGAHTLHHVVLRGAPAPQAWEEIAGSRRWLEDTLGIPCPMFCPPQGKFSPRDLALIRAAGFTGVRTVELLSLDAPRSQAGLRILPTTIQAHPHGPLAYLRNTLKRAALGNLWRFITHGRARDWGRLAEALLQQAARRGGVFHLWGHSWELEETGQWQRLEDVLRLLSQYTATMPALSNGSVVSCQLPVVRAETGQLTTDT